MKSFLKVLIITLLLVGSPFAATGNTLAQREDATPAGEQVTNSVQSDYSQYIPKVESTTSTVEPPVGVDTTPMSFRDPIETKVELPESIVQWKEVSESIGGSLSPAVPDNAFVKVTEKRIEVTVKFTTYGYSPELRDTLMRYDAKVLKNDPTISAFLVEVPVVMLDGFVNEASGLPSVDYVEPNFYVQASYVPNDPDWPVQWGPQIIGMETAWDVQLGDRNVLVAVIDTGIDYTHPDLVDNYVPLGYDFFNNDNDPMDDNSHGTHVAGTIAASISNGVGIAGVANVSVMAEKFLDANGFGSDFDGASAITHAVDQGADILSNSWGGTGYSQLIADAVDYAISSGVIVVAAAGNSGSDIISYPAALPGVIGVSATDQNDQLAYFSSYGPVVDIAAPGVDIYSSVIGGYAYYSGTSMATPHVSGLLALLMSQFPSYTPTQLEELLYSTAVDLGDPGFDQFFGWGRIDASSAIFGLQDHNVRASISGPDYIPLNETGSFSVTVSNVGLMNETNVELAVYLNGTNVINQTIPTLNSGDSISFSYDIYGDQLVTYELFASVTPVFNETVVHDNVATKYTTVSLPIIHPSQGNVMMYYYPDMADPLAYRFEVANDTDPSAVQFDMYFYDSSARSEFFGFSLFINTYTRESSDIWGLFPYWIQTDVQIGDTIELFQKGQFVPVVGEAIIDYYGTPLDTWVVDDSFELVYFSKADGYLVKVDDYTGYTFLDMRSTNILPSPVHNLRIDFASTPYGVVGEEVLLDILLQNTGTEFEFFQVEVAIDGTPIYSQIHNQTGVGGYEFIGVPWTAPVEGYYNLSAVIFPVSNETYVEDNIVEATIGAGTLRNYDMLPTTFSWFDAVSNGENLFLTGDDIAVSVSLPFPVQFYDQFFTTLYVGSNGWMSFAEPDATEFWYDPFPTDTHPYAVAPFWNDLIADNNVYVWGTSDFFVVEYSNYYYLSGELAGTFEVVFFANGDILFQYQSINVDYISLKGLNYGVIPVYYNVIDEDLTGRQDYAVLFTMSGGSTGVDMLSVDLDVPSLAPGESGYISASVTNVWNSTLQYIPLYLEIDGRIEGGIFASDLAPGESMTFTYYWQNVDFGNYVIRAYTDVLPGEEVIDNNEVVEEVYVSYGHDLAITLDIFDNGDSYVLLATVNNLGSQVERDVSYDLYIDGVPVSLGNITYLATGSFSQMAYFWYDAEPGVHTITAYVHPVLDEANLENNEATLDFEVVPQNGATVAFQVNDIDTGDPIEGAFIYILNQDTNEEWFEYTNSSGGWQGVLPVGNYYAEVSAANYTTVSLWFSIDEFTDSLLMWVDMTSSNQPHSFEIISPVDNETRSGGIVLVDFDALSAESILYMDVYVNGMWVTSTGFSGYSLGVPVFSNGTNLIEIYVYWDNGDVLYDSVYVDSFDVVPIAKPEFGDYISLFFELNDNSSIHGYYNFTFMDYVSQFEVMVDLQIAFFNGTDYEYSSYYLVVNILNGYVPDSDMWWLFQHFYMFSGMTAPNIIQGLDYAIPLWQWGDVYFLVGEDIWNDRPVWVLMNYYGDISYVLKDNGMWVYANFGDILTATIIDSSFFGASLSVSAPPELYTVEGEMSNFTWSITGEGPGYYNVYVDGIQVENGTWDMSSELFTYVPGLSAGSHTVTLVVGDSMGNEVFVDIAVLTFDITPPDVSYVGNSTLTEGDAYAAWSTSDINPGWYEVYVDGELTEQGNWTDLIVVNLNHLVPGSYVIEIFVFDMYGNMAYDFQELTIMQAVEYNPPSVLGDKDFSYEANSTNNVVTWQISDESAVTYELYLGDDLIDTGNVTEGVISFNIDGLEPGRYEFKLVVTDEFGNTSEDSVVVYVLSSDMEEIVDKVEGKLEKKVPGFTTFLAILALLGLGLLRRFVIKPKT